MKYSITKPFKIIDSKPVPRYKLCWSFWLLPNIRYNSTIKELRISWLLWGINIFFKR